MSDIYGNHNDEELIELIHKGDECAQDYLLAKYKNMVLSRVKAYFLSGAGSDDIIQEGMIGLFKAIRDFNCAKHVSFKVFAKLCISRQIITAVKASTRQKHKPLSNYVSLDREDMFTSDQNDPQVVMLKKQELELMYDRIDSHLSDFEKTVLCLYLDGKSYRQISVKLDKSIKSIDNALQRMKKKLAKSIAEHKFSKQH